MVLRDKHRAAEPPCPAMASDQPVKKKQRIDAPDLLEEEENYEALFPSGITETLTVTAGSSPDSGTLSEDAVDCSSVLSMQHFQSSAAPPGIHNPHFPFSVQTLSGYAAYTASVFPNRLTKDDSASNLPLPESVLLQDLDSFQEHLVKQCLCGVSEESLRRPFNSRISIAEWPPDKVLIFLSNLQLLFDVYLKQNYKGSICPRLMDICDALVRNEYDWFDEVINLADHHSKFVNFMACRVVSSFLIVAKDNIDHNWLQKIIENVYLFDTINSITVRKINFSLDVIKRVVEWKDLDQHPLEDSAYINTANPVPPTDGPQHAGSSISSTFLHDAASSASTSRENISRESNLQSAFSNLHTTPCSSSFSSSLDSSTSSDCNAQMPPDRTHFNLHESVSNFPASHSGMAPNLSISHSNLMQNSLNKNMSDASLPEPQRQCVVVTVTDSESFDTTHVKCLTIKCLEHRWPSLVRNIKQLLTRFLSITNSENCILTFLSLWENIISVKANLSVVDTKPFYMDLQSFVELLRCTNLPSLIYTQLLSLFNEVLCYGSTLALQDILPEETCTLAHSVVRFVKDFRLLNDVRLRHSRTGFGFVGYESPLVTTFSLGSHFVEFGAQPVSLVDASYGQNDPSPPDISPSRSVNRSTRSSLIASETDKTMLQKMVLLVLKSVAVTVKEMRCDSSDSSIDSTDYNAIQDMQMVERSIRDVLKKLDAFLKNALDFLPESPFTKILIHLFSEQDDYLIESMVCTLDITVGIVYRNSVFPDLIPMLNPILTFIEFLEVVSHDSDVLLDYLVSNETCFLLYLLRFLKYVRRNWSKFVVSCQWEQGGTGSRVLEETMTVLIRLRHQISRLVSKSLFPYNISPVLRLLEVCESLYEGNELS